MTNFKVYSYPNNKINCVSFALVCKRGAMHEKEEEMGITHFVEHLCFRKAGTLNQTQIYSFFEENGVDLWGRTGKNFVEFYFSCRPQVFEDLIKLFAKMWFETDYSQEDIDSEKRVILNEIAINDQTNTDIILDKLWRNRLLCCNVLGTEYYVQSFSLEQIVDYKKRMLSSNTAIVVSGNFTNNHLCTIKNEFVNNFVPIEEEVAVDYVDKPLVKDKLIFVKDGLSSIDVHFSFHTTIGNDKNKFIEAIALDDVLFRGNSGYLVEILREKLGYIYEIESTLRWAEGELCWDAKLCCNQSDVKDIVILVENLLLDYVPTNAHLKYIKAFYYDNLPMLQDDPRAVRNCVVNGIVAINEEITLEDFAQQCAKPSADQLKMLLNEFLANKHVHVFGNVPKKAKKELKKHFES